MPGAKSDGLIVLCVTARIHWSTY